jgi:hypothetical protein
VPVSTKVPGSGEAPLNLSTTPPQVRFEGQSFDGFFPAEKFENR